MVCSKQTNQDGTHCFVRDSFLGLIILGRKLLVRLELKSVTSRVTSTSKDVSVCLWITPHKQHEMITQNVLCHLPEGKKDSPQPSQPLSPKGDICNVLALQASAGKGRQHTPESLCCPARDTPAPLPAHGLRRHEVLLVTSTLERDTTYCSSSLAEEKLAHPSLC